VERERREYKHKFERRHDDVAEIGPSLWRMHVHETGESEVQRAAEKLCLEEDDQELGTPFGVAGHDSGLGRLTAVRIEERRSSWAAREGGGEPASRRAVRVRLAVGLVSEGCGSDLWVVMESLDECIACGRGDEAGEHQLPSGPTPDDDEWIICVDGRSHRQRARLEVRQPGDVREGAATKRREAKETCTIFAKLL